MKSLNEMFPQSGNEAVMKFIFAMTNGDEAFFEVLILDKLNREESRKLLKMGIRQMPLDGYFNHCDKIEKYDHNDSVLVALENLSRETSRGCRVVTCESTKIAIPFLKKVGLVPFQPHEEAEGELSATFKNKNDKR